jgi:cation diffusion facilitator CzcD-associated flavoprotein CzcO
MTINTLICKLLKLAKDHNKNISMEDFEVVIIGSGFSGLTCGHFLKEEGIENFCILEKNKSLGGVWSHGGVGSYPGAACDVQSYTYLPF